MLHEFGIDCRAPFTRAAPSRSSVMPYDFALSASVVKHDLPPPAASKSGRLHHVVRTSVHLASCALPKPSVALCGPLRLIRGVNKTGDGPHDDSRMNAEEVSAGGLPTHTTA